MSVISDDALLPCPLCGGEVIGYEIHPHSHAFATFMPDHPGSYVAECPECDFYLTRPTRTETAAAWNRRTVPSHEGVVEWRPIETAPKDGTDILVWDGDAQCVACWDESLAGTDAPSQWAHCNHFAMDAVEATHWRPLDAPPALSPNKEDEDATA
jgi:hypothetical protein